MEVDYQSAISTTCVRMLSTHDLTRRSTIGIVARLSYCKLSTHDLTRRSTAQELENMGPQKPFNSRPHTEVDQYFEVVKQVASTFQLTTSHGGRPARKMKHSRPTAFNSRPHTEVDSSWEDELATMLPFQLTTSHGGRHQAYQLWIASDGFQLTTSHGGRRDASSASGTLTYLSTHDLTRRSTSMTAYANMVGTLSTHDLTRRSTNPSVALSVQL